MSPLARLRALMARDPEVRNAVNAALAACLLAGYALTIGGPR